MSIIIIVCYINVCNVIVCYYYLLPPPKNDGCYVTFSDRSVGVQDI